MGDDDDRDTSSKPSRMRRAVRAGKMIGGGVSALTVALSLHGLPMLVHVLPHAPQLAVRWVGALLHKNGVIEETGIRFRDEAHLLRIVNKIVSAIGRRVDESYPMVDARLADGSRVNIAVRPISVDGGTNPVWNPDGTELFYRNGARMMSVAILDARNMVVARPVLLYQRRFGSSIDDRFDVTPDGHYFIDLDDSVAEPPPTEIVLVQNFAAELKRLAPPNR